MDIDFLDFAVNTLGVLTAYTEEQRSRIKTDFIRREGKSRWYQEQILWSINEELGIYHKPQLSKYDLWFISGGTRVNAEGKVREYNSGRYENLKVSASKCDFSKCDDWWLIAYFEGDRKWFIWDLGKYKPRLEKDAYTHNKYTADTDNNYLITEDAWVFDFKDATMEGTLYGN